MNLEKIKELEKKSKEVKKYENNIFNCKIDRLDRLIAISKELNPLPKGWIFKKCPKCNSKIKTKRYSVFILSFYSYKHYICKYCDYESATKKRNPYL